MKPRRVHLEPEAVAKAARRTVLSLARLFASQAQTSRKAKKA